MNTETLYSLGIALIFVGVIVVAVAALLLLLSGTRGKERIRGGGAIIVGPIPIVFGTDKESVKEVLLLCLGLVIALIIAMVVYYLVFK
jgi:uncharacterized protein (TIGR00304 family)